MNGTRIERRAIMAIAAGLENAVTDEEVLEDAAHGLGALNGLGKLRNEGVERDNDISVHADLNLLAMPCRLRPALFL